MQVRGPVGSAALDGTKLAWGGEGNDVKVCDLAAPGQLVFKAKNVPFTTLDLEVRRGGAIGTEWQVAGRRKVPPKQVAA